VDPAGRFTEPRENYDHEHQDVRVENGVRFGDLVEFCAATGWTHVIDAGDATSATIDLTEDNVQFGIRAYDTAGHRSPAAAPAPG
jgi:hypothetical protein